MVHILLIIICINLYISFKYFKSIAAPPVLFCLGFLLCVLNSINYYKEWGLDKFHINTFVVLSIGISLFTITALIIKKRTSIFHKNLNRYSEVEIYIPIKILLFYVLFQIGVYALVFKDFQRLTGYTDFATVVSTVNYMNKFDETETISLPLFTRLLYKITNTLSYILSFLGVKTILNSQASKQIKLLYILIMGLSVFGPLLFGGRGGSIRIIWLIAFLFYFIYEERRKWNFSIPKKMIITTFSAVVLLVYSWSNFAVLLGRESDEGKNKEEKFYNIAVYCGAQIKNLDLYLNENSIQQHNDLIGYATFSNLYSRFIPKVKSKIINLFQFRDYKGYPLGNVYTCFQSYIYDFGYLGVLLIIIFSYFVTKLWCKIRYLNPSNKVMLLCIYCMLSYSTFFSFFSEGFFATVVNTSFISQLILWWLEYKLIIKLFRKQANSSDIQLN